MSSQRDPLNAIGCAHHPPLYRKIQMLVVDDLPDMLEAVCGVLEMKETVEIVGRAHDGAEAVQAVAALHPELVLMDVRMPAMDGLQASRLLAEHFPEIRVVLMSGEQSPELHDQCDASGADAFVFKMDLAHELDGVLNRLFPDVRPRLLA